MQESSRLLALVHRNFNYNIPDGVQPKHRKGIMGSYRHYTTWPAFVDVTNT